MSRTRHTEAEIIAVLKQVEAGRKAADVAREAGVFKADVTRSARRGRSQKSEVGPRQHSVKAAPRMWNGRVPGNCFCLTM